MAGLARHHEDPRHPHNDSDASNDKGDGCVAFSGRASSRAAGLLHENAALSSVAVVAEGTIGTEGASASRATAVLPAQQIGLSSLESSNVEPSSLPSNNIDPSSRRVPASRRRNTFNTTGTPSNCPASPRPRGRGTLLEPRDHEGPIRSAVAGSSGQHGQRDATRGANKSSDAAIAIAPLDQFELQTIVEPEKTRARLRSLGLAQWTKKVRRNGVGSEIKKAFRDLKKKILRTREVEPSKNGRHLDLDVSGTSNLIDERTGTSYVSNVICSSRYTAWNFLPRQLIFQFGKLANFYFLIISILQLIPGLSTTGNYTTIVPLMFFISISIAKEGYDDFRRYQLDKAENNKLASVLKQHKLGGDFQPPRWVERKWQEIKVGDIIRLKRNESVPADILLLHADGPNFAAYIETMALDGETNLKAKLPCRQLADRCGSLESLVKCNAHIAIEDPNINLYDFRGRVTVDGETLPLTNNEVVYRGSVLRNTAEAIGMVMNTGEECKIRMNANKNYRMKAPSLQFLVNRVVIIVVVLVLSLSIFNTAAYEIWAKAVEGHSWYLKNARVPIGHVLTSFIIMFNTMIPLSLYVSMEIIKLGQLFFMKDIDMYDPVTDTPMEARTTTINEELGQVSYIFSDKTGTLTENIMRFRKMTVSGTAWLHDFDLRREAEQSHAERQLQIRKHKGKGTTGNFALAADAGKAKSLRRGGSNASNWRSSARPAKAQPELRTEELLKYIQHKPNTLFAQKTRFFLLAMALCHTCLPEVQRDGSTDYQAASPDELALVRAAQELGFMVVHRESQSITLITRPGGPGSSEVRELYEVLDLIEFSSERKRMSVIVRLPDGRRCLICKGADTVIRQRLKLAPLANEEAAKVQRRASVRKSMEAEHALRKMSELVNPSSPRTSLSRDVAPFVISSGGAQNLEPLRNQLDSWLTDRETDVDLTSVDNPDAYTTSRASAHYELRRSVASGELQTPTSWEEEYYDNLVDESVAGSDRAVFQRTFQHVDDFATEGLRTLLYGYRFLDEQEYLSWKKIFDDASTSLVDRQGLVEKAGEMIEQNLDLAGATGIEDKLQKGVPETIDKLRRANIKMWMLTGDKRETAINVGHSCRLIKDYSNVIILDHEKTQVDRLMANSILSLTRGSIPHTVVVVDGRTLDHIESDTTLSYLFLDLAVIVDSVICCRASPSQKASLVKQIRSKVRRSVTLAIGDGENDIAMIQESHVGIGITGKEGLQAARSSDYSIAQFRFLQKLLLVHGRWNYIRTSKYILGTFWKELLFYLTQAFFQRYNGNSGTSLYENWSMAMFNTLFTSLPVIFLGIFEQDLSAATLLAVPELYSQGQRNAAFNYKQYFHWMFMATVEAVIVFYVMRNLFSSSLADIDIGLFAMGGLAFTCCVIIINTKLLFFEMHNKTWVSVLGWFLSVSGWALWTIAISAIYSHNQSASYGVRFSFFRRFGDIVRWCFVIILITWALLVFELAMAYIKKNIWPSDADVWQVLEKDEAIRQRLGSASYPVAGAGPEKAREGAPGLRNTSSSDESGRNMLMQPCDTMTPLGTIKSGVSIDVEMGAESRVE